MFYLVLITYDKYTDLSIHYFIGASQNVFIDTYTASEEDFAGANPHHLDLWVFQKFEVLFCIKLISQD